MASTFTAENRLEKQGIGENENTWGDKLNAALDQIDDALDGVVSIAMTSSGDVTLSQSNGVEDEARNRALILTGAPTSNIGLNIPNSPKNYFIRNKITNSASIRVQVDGDAGNELKIPSDFVGIVHSDGTNVYEMARGGTAADIAATSGALSSAIANVSERIDAVSNTVENSVARLDQDNVFQVVDIQGFKAVIEASTNVFTWTSADTGKIFRFENTSAIAQTLPKNMPEGWNVTLMQVGATVALSAGASTSLVNTSGHVALNNYGSMAALLVGKQEGADSHAWYFFQGATQA